MIESKGDLYLVVFVLAAAGRTGCQRFPLKPLASSRLGLHRENWKTSLERS